MENGTGVEVKKGTKVVNVGKQIPTMFESLMAIQIALQTVTKDKKAFKGTYATIENVWQSIRDTINGNGFVVTHTSTLEGIYTYAMHMSGEKLSCFMPWSGNKDSQEQGKELTYAHRYGINALFNVIVADEDTDAQKPVGNYKKKDVDGTLAAKKMQEAKNRADALTVYNNLSKDERMTTEVIQAVEEMRKKYDNVE